MVSSVVMLCVSACGGPQQPSGEAQREYLTTIVSPAQFEGDFAMEQEVTFSYATESDSFRAVLQKQGDTITLLGLAPHGGRGFTLIQRGDEVSFEAHVDIDLPFPPRYILYDVHRTWFVPTEGSPADGAFTRQWHDEQVTETWSDGRLRERRFTSEREQEFIAVRYEGGLAPNAPLSEQAPPEATLSNGWFGYEMTVRTLSWTAIPPAEASTTSDQ